MVELMNRKDWKLNCGFMTINPTVCREQLDLAKANLPNAKELSGIGQTWRTEDNTAVAVAINVEQLNDIIGQAVGECVCLVVKKSGEHNGNSK